MRILISHSFYRVFGGEDRYVQLQFDLLRENHEVELFGERNRDLEVRMRTAAQMTFSSRQRTRTEEAINRFRPDIVHLHNAYPSIGPAVHLAAERCGVPLVMTVHNFRLRCPNGLAFTEGAPCQRCQNGMYLHGVIHRCFPTKSQAAAYAAALWVHRFILKLESKVAVFIAPSDFMRRQFIRWGLPNERIETVPNFTRPMIAASEPGEYGLFFGRLSPEKGLGFLLRALALAGDPPFKVVGDGPAGPELRSLASELGLQRTVFLGRLPPEELAPIIQGSRFVVLPSLSPENAPLAALEAMAAGRALIVTAVGGLPELVRHGEGETCPPDDIMSLADSIRRFIEDSDQCEKMGARALARAKADFAPEVHLRRLETAYEKALARLS